MLFVYLVATYLITIKETTLYGWTILLAHLYKDVTGMQTWPTWTEYAGLLIAAMLIRAGLKLRNLPVLAVGVSKLLAHTRQLIFRDNVYYIKF